MVVVQEETTNLEITNLPTGITVADQATIVQITSPRTIPIQNLRIDLIPDTTAENLGITTILVRIVLTMVIVIIEASSVLRTGMEEIAAETIVLATGTTTDGKIINHALMIDIPIGTTGEDLIGDVGVTGAATTTAEIMATTMPAMVGITAIMTMVMMIGIEVRTG